SMIQQPSDSSGNADLIFLTHQSIERSINAAISRIESLHFVRSSVTRLRVESLS
ncbi:MAG: homoserine dehydrogenase, partial [Zwartia sp.]|nr:homoserine dehydrogenase [Zwartia sp.]